MNVIHMRGAKEAPKAEQSKMETMLLTPHVLNSWTPPPFQRPVRMTSKVKEVSLKIAANGGCIFGVITLGHLPNDSATYLLDGQQWRQAALLTELGEFIADLRVMRFSTMAEMAEEFVRLNSQIVKLMPDDILRGLEGSIPALRKIKNDCPFVGYGHVRRRTESPILSMSAVVRCWTGSAGDTPGHTGNVGSVANMASAMQMDDAEQLVRFLLTARAAWGDDVEYARLWGNLNLTICMWLWRRLVVDRERSGNRRYVLLSIDQFKKCLMTLSANSEYLDWLVGRLMGDRDRSPCYARIKAMFVRRLIQDSNGKKVQLPQPVWSST